MWEVVFHPEFKPEFSSLNEVVQDALLLQLRVLQHEGPRLGRPQVDTLKGSQFSNMKEPRFHTADGAWRVAFAFDPLRQAVLLVAGSKSGRVERRFYKQLIEKADLRFHRHLSNLGVNNG